MVGAAPARLLSRGGASVWGALRALGAERLGHGVRSIEDPALVEHRLPLEVCPTSNLRLGVYVSLDEHPLPLAPFSGFQAELEVLKDVVRGATPGVRTTFTRAGPHRRRERCD